MEMFIVDAFTATPFSGNPAAVCLLSDDGDDPGRVTWMQKVAAEMNLSETAFVWPRPDGFGLRWFTPSVEVDLCGHATLGSAHALWETGRLAPSDPARFRTLSGPLTATRIEGGWIELDFPAEPTQPAKWHEGLAGLGLPAPPRSLWRSRLDLLVEVDDAATVRAVAPDMSVLATVPARGVIVTGPGTGDVDYVLRFFGPAIGLDEDPVTGSAQCTVGPWWSDRLGRADLLARQLSPRGGTLRVRPRGDRVRIAGQAVTVTRGELLV